MTKSISKRTLDFISFIPFGVAISAFILYLRYSLPIIMHEKIAVTGLILNYANRFRNIAIFSGIIGIVFLIITSIIYYSTGNREVYKPTVSDLKIMLLKAKSNITKAINIIAILLCIILILLLGLQINKQSNINKQNLNIKAVELFN
ncbi:MAG: hypothetical protein IKP98_04045 [Bacilli bacterium]|nr:hypothetical protein [Bacilli bacterium]